MLAKPKLEKTNLPGFAKDKKYNVLVNTNEDKINQIKRDREIYIKQQGVNKEVELLKYKVENLTKEVESLKVKLEECLNHLDI